MIAAASTTQTSGLPLWLVCTIAFVAMLFVGLYVLLAPMSKRQRVDKQARIDEVHRYRVLGAYSGIVDESVVASPTESALTTKALAVVDRAVRARGQHNRLLFELERAGMRMRPEEWAALQLAITVGARRARRLRDRAGRPGDRWCAGLARLPVLHPAADDASAWTTSRRSLPDALQMLAGALRTGFALNQALGTVVREGIEPISSEFGRALHEVRLGANLEDALDDVVDRMKSYDMGLVVMAIRTAREVGGNLAEVLQTTVHTMRERVELQRAGQRAQRRRAASRPRCSSRCRCSWPPTCCVQAKLHLRPLYTTGAGIALLVGGASPAGRRACSGSAA